MKTAKQTFSQNSFILILSTFIVKIIGAIFKIPLASNMFLGDLGFGYYSIAHDIYMPFYILALSGLPSAVSHITAEYIAKNDLSIYKKFKKIKKTFIIFGVLFSMMTVILSIPFVFSNTGSENAVYSVFAILPSIFLVFIISVYRGYFEGHNNMYPTAISKIIEAVFKLLLGLVMSFVVIRVTHNFALASAAALFAISLGTLFATLYLSIKYKKGFKTVNNTIEDDLSFSVKYIFALALPYVLASLSASIISLLDLITVKSYISGANIDYLQQINLVSSDISTHLYGIRSKAFTLFYLIPTITMSLGISAIPILTNAYVSKDVPTIKNSVNYSLKLISFITFPSAIGLSVLSKPIMELLYSSTDSYSANLLFLYGISALFAGIAIPLTSILQAIGKQKSIVIIVIISIVIKTLVNILAVSNAKINILAAPIGTIVCYIFMLVSLFVILNREVEIDILSTLFKPFLSGLLCGGIAFMIWCINDSKTMTVIAIIVAVIVYLISNFLLKTFTKEEIKSFPLTDKLNFLDKIYK